MSRLTDTRTSTSVINKNSRPDESNHRARNWIATLANYEEVDLVKLQLYAHEKCKYMIIGKEVGKTGLPHLQIYMQLEKQTGGQTVKNQSKCLNMWMGIANDAVKSREYSMKEGDYVEFGTFDKNAGAVAGRRAGSVKGGDATKKMWQGVTDAIFAGAKEKDLMLSHPHLYFRYSGGMKAGIAAANVQQRRNKKTCVHAYIGPPGVGKTTKAESLAGGSPYFYNSPNKIWWSTYDGVSPVIMDDFHGEYPFGDFKKLLDKYPHQVPVHGSLINFNPSIVIITSNEMPGQWYRQEVLKDHGMSALLRRINVLQVWDSNSKTFVDTDLQGLWNEGCLCPQTKVPGSQDSTVEVIEESSEDPKFPPSTSESVGTVIPNTPLSLPMSTPPKLKRTLTSVVPSPPKKIRPKLRGKSIDDLKRFYPEPIEISDETDDASSASWDNEMEEDSDSVESISDSY